MVFSSNNISTENQTINLCLYENAVWKGIYYLLMRAGQWIHPLIIAALYVKTWLDIAQGCNKNIPKRSPHRCSRTLLSLVRTPHSLQPLLSPSLDALSRAWNSERTFLTCIWSSFLASSLSVAQATQSLGREKPSIHHTALWWACLDVKRRHSLSSGWALDILSFSHQVIRSIGASSWFTNSRQKSLTFAGIRMRTLAYVTIS